MSKTILRIISSFTMAAVLSCTSLAAFAEESIDTTYIGDVGNYVNLGIDDYANDIKKIYKFEYPDKTDMIDNMVDTIIENDVFTALFAEDGMSAFQIVEDSLRDVLEPSTSLCDCTDELYFSKYDFSPIKQDSSSKNAAAAALMALKGSGITSYTQTTVNNALNNNSTSQSTIKKITELLKDNIPQKNGNSVKTRAFVTTYGGAYALIDCLGTALVYDTVPVIEIGNASDLSWYNNGETGKRYLVATCVDIVAECVTFYDPDSDHYGSHSLDYDELDELVNTEETIWVSAYSEDKSYPGLAAFMAEYPDGSSYTKNGLPCNKHVGTTCNNCICDVFSWSQCASFAANVFHAVKGRDFRASEDTVSRNTSYYEKDMTGTSFRSHLLGLTVGSYIRVGISNYIDTSRNQRYNGHSVAVINTSSSGINIYDANSDCQCGVRVKFYSWEDFAADYPVLYFIVT